MGAACHSKSKKSSQPQSQPQIRDESQPQPPVLPPKEEITQIREETQKIEENPERRENVKKDENWQKREEDKIGQEIEPDILPKEKTSSLKKNEQFPGVIAFPHYEGDNEGEREEMRTSLHSTQKTRREIFGEASKGLIGNTRNVGDFDEPVEGEEVF